jgi:hypothetical protein
MGCAVWLQILEAYKLGISALKSTLKGSGLTEDSVADTMVQVEEVSWYKEKNKFLFSYLNICSSFRKFWNRIKLLPVRWNLFIHVEYYAHPKCV